MAAGEEAGRIRTSIAPAPAHVHVATKPPRRLRARIRTHSHSYSSGAFTSIVSQERRRLWRGRPTPPCAACRRAGGAELCGFTACFCARGLVSRVGRTGADRYAHATRIAAANCAHTAQQTQTPTLSPFVWVFLPSRLTLPITRRSFTLESTNFSINRDGARAREDCILPTGRCTVTGRMTSANCIGPLSILTRPDSHEPHVWATTAVLYLLPVVRRVVTLVGSAVHQCIDE
ncbi:hypothetical protein FB451DRAFT_1177753 [Mycena latifolia]|nr:hypothetical protein FB451DRAFT_1177753 [Mycena latifolia]